jgi:hypothetical protein
MVGLTVPLDGRICSQNVLSAPLYGGEAMEIVSSQSSAAATNANGNSFQVTLDVLAAFFAAFPALNTELITAGATLVSPYDVQTTDTRILFNKTLGSASYAVCPPAASMLYGQPVLFKDINGDAATNIITVTFSGGELCDGEAELQITTVYGWFEITPKPGGGAWYQSG